MCTKLPLCPQIPKPFENTFYKVICIHWFQSYLINHKQYVSIYGEQSESHEINCGVPQGSVIGPLLF